MAASTSPLAVYLVPIAGPALGAITLTPTPGHPLTIGRLETCDLILPADAEKVSRVHARVNPSPEGWRLADAGSRWGTFLNGIRLDAGREMQLCEGDLIRITPWTFSFTSRVPHTRGQQSINDEQSTRTMIRSFTHESISGQNLAGNMLAVLLEGAAGIHAATDEKALAAVVLEEACRGTGLPNGAFLRPLDSEGRVEVVATRSAVPLGDDAPIFSRSLLRAASAGAVATLNPEDVANASQSIVQARIDTALCVPLMLGNAAAAFLYLDSRTRQSSIRPPQLHAAAAEFCVALGRMASLALANLKRLDVERRQALIEAELSAAATAQKWILPPRRQAVGSFEILGESRPGQYVGGDFFDVIRLPDGRFAVALGDVSGKGIAASVLMTATQGYLHAVLKEHGDVGRAVSALNQFVSPRRPESRFVTLWAGVFDPAARTLSYVDAGHGYALLLPPVAGVVDPGQPGRVPADISAGPLSTTPATGASQQLSEGSGMPIGVMPDAAYEAITIPLPAGSRTLIISDGFIEQPAAASPSSHAEQFGLEGVRRALANPSEDELSALFAALTTHAGGPAFADDATAVIVKCS